MSRAQVHFEVFVRRKVNAPWTLEIASEDRAYAFATAEELLAEGRAAAVRVSKETLDEDTREFNSLILLSKGEVNSTKERKLREVEHQTPLCITPQDLYSGHARQRIGRLLEAWLRRKGVTPFELLHRPDLIEQLEASGTEIQHAVQKIAVPEAQARGKTTHEMMRAFQGLVDRSIERLMKDGRKKLFPKVDLSNFARVADQLADEPERAYLLSGGVAAFIASAESWEAKVGCILDLAEAARSASRGRNLAYFVLEQPLSEIVAVRGGLDVLLGSELDLGGLLAAMTRMAAGDEVQALLRFDPGLVQNIPSLAGEAARLASWLQGDTFAGVRASLIRRILTDITGPRRLRPTNPTSEIDVLRALAMALTASCPRLLSLEEVQAAFVERSKMLVGGDFVALYLKERPSALAEIEALVRLAENVAGGANKRAAARWVVAGLGAIRFEKEMRGGPAPSRLASLAELQHCVRRAALPEAEERECVTKLGDLGHLVEQDTKLVSLIAKSEGPLTSRLTVLLRLAVGEAGPLGPVADRARVEVVKLLKLPEVRAHLVAAPASLSTVRALMVEAGLAA